MKDITVNRYLVLFDFTKSTEDAFDYARVMVKQGGGEIFLIHMVDEEEELESANRRLETFVLGRSVADKACIHYRAVVGNIYTDLTALAESFDASAIVVGIENRTGIQKAFGTNALKMVADSHIPFIITPEGGKTKISSIVMPFNFRRKSLQITQFATAIAKKFDATIHLVGNKDSEADLAKEMELNAVIVHNHLEEEGVPHDIITLSDQEPFHNAVLNYAESIDADLIAAAYFDDSFFSIFNTFVDELIENKSRIPVITVNGPEVMKHSPKLDYVPV